ncbi:hypothetical protein [Deinococcus pimensis]|uniref:hypothetical protein n=1 Tax=Deinococcus pimensis TaxID=309888 RepID=UPI0012F94B1A|nr:hypothetical protein [Deinococcus pimensis]
MHVLKDRLVLLVLLALIWLLPGQPAFADAPPPTREYYTSRTVKCGQLFPSGGEVPAPRPWALCRDRAFTVILRNVKKLAEGEWCGTVVNSAPRLKDEVTVCTSERAGGRLVINRAPLLRLPR